MKKITKAGIAVAAVAAVATSAMVISAFGPDNRKTYTMENPADKVTFNSITNNPTLIGSTNVADCNGANKNACDERYFVSASVPRTLGAIQLRSKMVKNMLFVCMFITTQVLTLIS